MKKVLTIIIASSLILTLFSCKYSNAKGGNAVAVESSVEKKGSKTIHLTKDEFLMRVVDYKNNPDSWKYLGDKPAIVDFYASWCGPCKMLAPILEELALQYEGDIYIYKVDTEDQKELARDFGIQAIPTILFIPMTGDPQVAQGALPKEELVKIIDSFLLKKVKE